MTRTIRILTFLAVMAITATTAWADEEPQHFGHITYNGNATGGTLEFYTSSRVHEEGNKLTLTNGQSAALTSENISDSRVYIKATPAVGHRLPNTEVGATVSFIQAEVVTQAQQAPSRRNAPDPTLEVGQTLPVKFYGYYSGNSFGDDPATEYYGLYYVVMPADANLSVSITATFPEVATNATAIDYVDVDGSTKSKAAGTVYVLDGSEARLGYGSFNYQTEHETWYVCNKDLTYTNGLEFYGKVHLILADGKTMTYDGTERFIYSFGNLDIYGQGGETEGTINAKSTEENCINVTGYLTINGGNISAESTNTSNVSHYGIKGETLITINGGTVNGKSNVTGIGGCNIYINGGIVNGTGTHEGISTASGTMLTITGGHVCGIGDKFGMRGMKGLIITGGQIEATSGTGDDEFGIYSDHGDIILGWTNPDDYIKANSYHCGTAGKAVKTVDGKRLVALNMANDTDNSASTIVSGTVDDVTPLAGRTLKPLDGNYIEATSGLQIGSLNGKDFTVRDADFSIDYAHYYLFSAAAEDVVVYYSNEYLPSDYHSIVWNVTGTSLKAYNYFGSGPRNMDNRYATFDMPGNADVTIDYESGGDGRMYQMPGGPLGSDSYWELSEDGSVLILDGTGDITVEKVDEWVNYNIKSISFSESVHYINNEVFAGLTHLETVSIGKNVERIGNGVFSGCTSLTSVTFPLLEYPSAINIGNGVFAGCTSLTSVTFQDTKVPTIGTDVFPATTTIIVPLAALQSYYNATSWASYKAQIVAGLCGKTESDHVTWTLTRLTTGFKVATAWNMETEEETAWTTIPAYKLTISGTGAMADYNNANETPWAVANPSYSIEPSNDPTAALAVLADKSVITELEIGAGITALGANAFTGLSNLTSLTIATGSALTTIAPADFAGNHTTVTLPTTVTTIDLKNNPATLQGHINNAAWRYYKSRFTPVGGYCGTTANDANGHNLSWTLAWKGEAADDNGRYPLTLTITGTGAMKDYGLNSDEAPWKGFFAILSPLPNELTTIGNFAFNYGAISGTLDIPTSVTRIGEWAFQNCSGLTAVNILGAKDAQGNALTTIDQAAFRDNSNLATVNLGDGVKDIGNNAFSSIGITEVTIPASVERIGFSAFAVCPSLKTVCMNRGTDGSITVFGHNQDGVYNQFGNCTSLETILVPAKALLSYLGADGWSAYADKVISTGYCGKDNTETTDVDESHNLIWTLSAIANTTVTVNNEDVPALKLTVSANTANPVNAEAEGAFDMADKSPTGYPWGTVYDDYVLAIHDIVIKDGVTSIGNETFRFPNAMNITNATIGKDVKTICEGAFNGTNLANVTFAANSTLETIGFKAFLITDLTDITIPASVKTIGGNAFEDCEQLETVTIEDTFEKPSQLTTIGGSAFKNTKIETITLPKSVTDIEGAFRGCTTLQTVNFAADAMIETIGSGAFLGCTSLQSITIPASVKTIFASAFDECTTLTQNDYVLTLPTTVTDVFATTPSHLVTSLASTLWSNATEKLSYSGNCGVEVLNEQTQTYINSDMNVQFTMRSNGTLSDNSPALKMNIYKNTKNPTGSDFSIAGNDDADYMPWANAKTHLTAVVIEDGVEGIGNNAFAGCSALTTFRVKPTTPPVLGTNVFDGCTALTDIIAPANYKTADGWKSEGIIEKLRADREDLFTSGTEWMTWCGDFDWSAPAGCSVYVVSGVGENTVTLTALTETANADRTEGEENAEGIRIPAYTPVILQKTVANATGLQARFAKVGTVPTSGYNATTGLVTKTETGFSMLGAAKETQVTTGYQYVEGYSYGLYNSEFVLISADNGIPAHRCILTLDVPLSASRLHININGEATSLSEAKEDSSLFTLHSSLSGWYTLDGRKLDKQPTTKGLYIFKGKKVVIK